MSLDIHRKGTDNCLARIVWIDVIKGIGILLVILGHTNPPFMKIIYGFHMPLFFVISGFLWKDNITMSYVVKKNILRLILPYFFLCSINLGLELLMGDILHEDVPIVRHTIGILYSRGTTYWMPNCSPLWYLTAAFVAFVLFALLYNQSVIIFVLGLIFAGILSALLSYYDVIKLPWNIDTALMGIVFMGLGHYLNRADVFTRIANKAIVVKAVVCIVLFMLGISMILLNPAMVDFDGNRYGNAILMIMGASSICIVLLYISFRISWRGTIEKYLTYLGKHTIFFIGFDYFVGTIISVVLSRLNMNYWGPLFMTKVFTLCTGCIIWTILVSLIRNEKIRKILTF